MTVRREQTATGSAMSSLHKACAGLGVAPLPARMPDRIAGKNVVEAVRIDLGQTQTPSARMFKSRFSDTMKGARGGFSRWSSESKNGNGLGTLGSNRRMPVGKKGRNMRFVSRNEADGR